MMLGGPRVLVRISTPICGQALTEDKLPLHC